MISGQYAGDLRVAIEGGVCGLTGAQRFYVCIHHQGDQSGADGSVRRVQHAAQRTGESVYGAERGICQRHAAEETRQRHSLTRLLIPPVVPGGPQ